MFQPCSVERGRDEIRIAEKYILLEEKLAPPQMEIGFVLILADKAKTSGNNELCHLKFGGGF